jgi:hypothetical protein
MIKDRFKIAYFNGCSFTQGGGLETINDVEWNERDENGVEKGLEDGRRDVLKIYNEIYGIPYWNSRLDVAYPSIFANITHIQTINDSQSGGGIERIIRTTQDFLADNWENRKDLLVILELADFQRLEFYSNTFNDYVLFNYTIHPDLNILDEWFSCRDYSKRNYSEDNNHLKPQIDSFAKEFLHPKSIFQNLTRDLINFLSFLQLNDITFYISEEPNYEMIGIKEKMFSERVLPIGSPYQWAQINKGRIVDEVPIEDVHPGVLGHRGYAKELVSYLELKHR